MARTKKQPEQYAIRAAQIESLTVADALDMVRYAQASADGTIERDGTHYYLFSTDSTDLYHLARIFARWRSFGCEPMKLDTRYGTPERPYATNAIGWPV